jgi:hypothetical protein
VAYLVDVVHADGIIKHEIVDTDNVARELKQLQSFVGGYLELFTKEFTYNGERRRWTCYVDEDAELTDEPINLHATLLVGFRLRGNLVIVVGEVK